MKLSQSEQDQILALMTRLYVDISDIESRHNLLIGEGDYRPRIEYFHDAIRAFTSKKPVTSDGKSRLNIEWLSYDVQALRYVQSMPLASLSPHPHFSASTDIANRTKGALAPASQRPDRATKEQLAELYQRYAILFAALLKPFADNDYYERTDEANQDIATILSLVAQLEKGGATAALTDSIHNLEDDVLRIMLQNFVQSGKIKKPQEMNKLLTALKGEVKKKNKTVKTVEQAHMDYALAQLGLYEASKDVVKKMAASGMNLVGNFVEKAMRETQRELGR